MKKRLPELIITDIDGVWTDGGMYYGQTGNEWKKFNTYDSAGIIFAKELGIEVAVITSEDTKIVTRRCKKLKIKYLYQGVNDKLKIATDLCHKIDVEFDRVAYIGDDIGDLSLLRMVGISGAPLNAQNYIKSEVDIVTKKSGGEGAFREFVESIIGINRITNILKESYSG